MEEEIIKNLKDCHMDKDRLKQLENGAEKYKDKSEEEIYLEIIRINEEIEKEMSYEEYENLFHQLKNIRPLLNDEQNIKLDYLLKQLKSD